MARDNCRIDVYNKKCIYGGWKSINNRKITIWPPSCCRSTQYFELFKKHFGVDYLLVAGVDDAKSAIDAGWDVSDMILWISKGTYTFNQIKYTVNTIYQYYIGWQHPDDGKIGNMKPLHAIAFEEPFHTSDAGYWNDLNLCLYKYNDLCNCVNRIITGFRRYHDDNSTMSLIRLAYYIKNGLTVTVDNANGVHINRLLPTNVIAYDYDNRWLFGGRNAFAEAKALNNCFHLFDEIADDHYDEDEYAESAASGICSHVLVQPSDDFREMDSTINSAKNANIRQITIIGLDQDYCNADELDNMSDFLLGSYRSIFGINLPEETTPCDKFIKHVSDMYNILQKWGYVEQDARCWKELVATKVCIYNNCNLCDPNNPNDWLTYLIK
jgi:hypothetical protein